MTLVKSKINSLAWLKPAIYISVIGGVILSSKPTSAIGLTSDGQELGQLSLSGLGLPTTFSEDIIGNNWGGRINIQANRGDNNDTLSIFGSFHHKEMPSHSHNSHGEAFVFNLSLDADNEKNGQVTGNLGWPTGHGANHSDVFTAILTISVRSELTSLEDRISGWNFNLTGEHQSQPVPEPTTIFGSALALGVGGWLKRKKSSQHDKAMP